MTVSRPELARLLHLLEKTVRNGSGTTLFVVGEPGIGKSTLVAELMDRYSDSYNRNVLTATGRCIDIGGISRGYLPWQEVLIELDADRAAGSDAEKKQSFKAIIKTLFDECGSEWIQNIPQIGEISSAILKTARAIQQTEDLEVSSGELRDLSFRERVQHVVRECTGTWLGAIPVVGGLVEAVFKTSQTLAVSRADLQMKNQEDFFLLVMHRLRAFARENPVVVFLDDLQWADPSSLGLFLYLAKNLKDAPYPLLLIGSYRPEDIRQGRLNRQSGTMERHPLQEKLNTLQRYEASTSITLGQFNRDQVEAYVATRFPGHRFGADFIERLLHVTNGNVLFLQETLTNLVEHGVLSDSDGTWRIVGRIDIAKLPGTIEGVIRERHERLTDELRELLTVAAVVGEEFALEIIESILQENRIRLQFRLGALIEKHGMVRKSSDAVEMLMQIYEFTHNLVQKYIYQNLDAGFRRDLHRAIAETMKSVLNTDQLRRWKAQYGFHLGMGYGIIDEHRQVLVEAGKAEEIDGGEERLREFLQVDVDLADEFITAYNNAEALLMCDEVLKIAQVLGDDRTTMAFLGKKAEVLEFTGVWSEAEALQQRRLAMAIEHGRQREQGAAYLGLGAIMRQRGEYDRALEAFQQALRISRETENRSGISGAIGNIGNVHYARGEYDQALEAYRRQLSIAEEMEDHHGMSGAIGNIGNVHYARGEYDRALEAYRRQLSIAEKSGDRSRISSAVGNMGSVYYWQGEYDRALEAFGRQLSIAEKLGDRNGAAGAVGNMGSVYSAREEYDRAMEAYRRQLSIAEELGDRNTISYVMGNIGIIHFTRGEYDRAMEAYRQQLSIAEMLGDRKGISVALGSIGNLYHEQGEHDRALQSHRRKLAIDEELGDRRGASIAVGNMGSIYSDRGEYDRALEAFARAIADHRAIGFRYGLAASLTGAADTLLAIVEAGDPMPEHLPRHLPELDEERWQRDSLRSARKWSEEALRIAGEISRPEFLFSCRILLARLEAAEGRRDHAVKALEDLLGKAESDEQRAEARYRLWKLGERKERAAAAMLYEMLYAKTPMCLYRERLAEMKEGEQEQ